VKLKTAARWRAPVWRHVQDGVDPACQRRLGHKSRLGRATIAGRRRLMHVGAFIVTTALSEAGRGPATRHPGRPARPVLTRRRDKSPPIAGKVRRSTLGNVDRVVRSSRTGRRDRIAAALLKAVASHDNANRLSCTVHCGATSLT